MPKITRPSLATKCNWSGKSEIGKSRQHVIPRRSSQSRRPFHVSSEKQRISCISLPIHNMHNMHVHIHAYPCAYPQYAQADANMHLHARPSGPLNVFDPWSKLCWEVYPCKTRLTKPWAGPLGIRKWAWATFGNALTLDQGEQEHVR